MASFQPSETHDIDPSWPFKLGRRSPRDSLPPADVRRFGFQPHVKTLMSALIAVALVGFGARQVIGDEEPGLAFVDTRPLILSWAQAQIGATARVCNVSSRVATTTEGNLTGFSFKLNSKPLEDGAVILQPSIPGGQLPGGQCADLYVKLKEGALVDPGSYTGLLVVTSKGAGIARLDVTLAGPGSVPSPPTIAGAIETTEFRATRNPPWGDATIDGVGELPLKAPQSGQLALGRACDSAASQGRNETACPFVGNAYNGTHVARFFINGRLKETKGAVFLPIRVEGADQIGVYEGSLDLAGMGNEKEFVKVKLTVTDAWWWAAFAVLIGAIPAMLMQLWSGRSRLKLVLYKRLRDLEQAYVKGAADFHTASNPNFQDIHRPDKLRIDRYTAEVVIAIRAYASSALLFDVTSDAYKKIDASVALPERDAHFMGQKDGLSKSLTRLKAELHALAEFLRDSYPVQREPQIARNAASALKGTELSVGGATELAAAADAFVVLLKSWRGMANQVLRYLVWAHRLAERRLPQPDLETMGRIQAKLMEIRMELLDATSQADLNHLRTARDLDGVYQSLAELGARHGVWVSPEDSTLADATNDAKTLRFAAQRVEVAAFAAVVHDIEQWVASATTRTVNAARSADIAAGTLRLLRWTGDIGALAVSIAVGIGAGLALVYFGNTFGTVQDYIKVILVGAASQVLVKGVLDQLSTLWSSATSPKVVAEPQSAAASGG